MSPQRNSALFEVDFVGGVASRRWAEAIAPLVGDVEDAFAWGSLDPDRYDAELLERGRVAWTASAFNEYATAVAMGQLLELFGRAAVPLDLWGIAATFPIEELLHVELCSRVAMRLGGGAPIVYDPGDLRLEFEPDLTPLQQATELVVRLCCVGEAFSLPMLVAAMDRSTHALTRSVLTQIVKDEAMHGQLGWMYLDWIASALDDRERARLARAAEDTAGGLRRIWEEAPAGGQEDPLASDMAWIPAKAYAQCARAAEQQIAARLATYGIVTDLVRTDPVPMP
jgi:hypothetical protein